MSIIKMSNNPLKSVRFLLLPYIFFIAALLILMAIIITMTIKDLNRGRQTEIQTLLEKSSVLIRAFESGTRSGMMGASWRTAKYQRLLEEMAYQPGVIYIAITDPTGKIIAHSDPNKVGTILHPIQEMEKLNINNSEQWRFLNLNDPHPEHSTIFETYRLFKPLQRANSYRNYRNSERQTEAERRHNVNSSLAEMKESYAIFAAFDTETLQATYTKDLRNAVIFLSTLFLLALASVLALLLLRRYQDSKRALQDSQLIYSDIISHLPIGLLTTTANQKIAIVNRAAEQIINQQAQQLIGQNFNHVLPANWQQLAERSKDQQTILEYELDYDRGLNQLVALSLSVTNIVNSSGQFLGNLFVIRDLSEVRQLQEEIRRKEKLAAIGSLAAGVAHEIRNPLSSIKGFAQYFESICPTNSEEHKLAKVMTKEVERLNRAVTELLDLVRPSDLNLQLSNIYEVVEHSLQLIKEDANSKQVLVEFTHNQPLPLVCVDPDRLTQALLNLYLNALQAMGAGGVLNVSIHIINTAELHISVSDSGNGIAAEQLNHIFDPYFTTKAEGTGLGLSIVQKVIEAHQGRVTVTSELGSGSCFTLILPIKNQSDSTINKPANHTITLEAHR